MTETNQSETTTPENSNTEQTEHQASTDMPEADMLGRDHPPTFRLHLGAAYYPEHWPEERWEEEIDLMKAANMSVIRLAEFAWSSLQPSKGKYKMDWLARVIELLSENDILTVLGTPTAAPPAWLTAASPETVAVDEFGRRAQHGNRCHYCVNSAAYHEATRRIVSRMAKQFGSDHNVIGWQIDNEFSRVCYCDICRGKFQEFLKERHGSLDVLNQRWSTAYWSQTYSAWEQIPIPIGNHNPGLMLDFKRFVTHSYRSFQKLQIDALRPHLHEGAWITHNFMGWFDGFDHYQLAEDLDIASWDDYVGTGHYDYLNHSAVHALTRGFKQKNFWVMETQPGNVNWSTVNNMLDRGEARAMAWQGVAHGADAILYWQWRSALGGQEQYHGSLVDQSGQPRLFYEEAAQIGEEFAKVSDLLEDSAPKARVAMIFDYESRWAIGWQKHHQDFDYVEHFRHYYRSFALRNVAVDILSAKSLHDVSQLKPYKIVVAPALNISTEIQAKVLGDFTRRGGHLVLTLRTGMKDEHNALIPIRQPGYMTEFSGMEVEEYFALDEPVPMKGSLIDGHARIWAERLKLTGKFVLPMGKYKRSNGWLDDAPGISVTGVLGGPGLVYYIGAYLDDVSQQIMVDRFLFNAQIKPINTPDDVEVRTRVKTVEFVDENGVETGESIELEIYIVINHSRQDKTVWLPWLALEHLTGEVIEEGLNLGPYGVGVITKIEEELIEEFLEEEG